MTAPRMRQTMRYLACTPRVRRPGVVCRCSGSVDPRFQSGTWSFGIRPCHSTATPHRRMAHHASCTTHHADSNRKHNVQRQSAANDDHQRAEHAAGTNTRATFGCTVPLIPARYLLADGSAPWCRHVWFPSSIAFLLSRYANVKPHWAHLSPSTVWALSTATHPSLSSST